MNLEQAEIQLDLFLIQNPKYIPFQLELNATLDSLPEAMRLLYIFDMMLDSQDELKAELEDACQIMKLIK